MVFNATFNNISVMLWWSVLLSVKMRGECLFCWWHYIDDHHYLNFFSYPTSVDTEMCCPKGECGCQYFILLTLKKKIMDFFNKKLILDYYFCLMSGPVVLFQIFIIAPFPLPRDIKLYN